MKTSLQKLIERLEGRQSMWAKKSKAHIDIANTYFVAIIMAKKLLEEEKEQMFGYVKHSYIIDSKELEIHKELFEQWYNQNYNK